MDKILSDKESEELILRAREHAAGLLMHSGLYFDAISSSLAKLDEQSEVLQQLVKGITEAGTHAKRGVRHAAAMLISAASYFRLIDQLANRVIALREERTSEAALRSKAQENEMYIKRGYLYIDESELSSMGVKEVLARVIPHYHGLPFLRKFRKLILLYGQSYPEKRAAKFLRVPPKRFSYYSSYRKMHREADGTFDPYTIIRDRERPDGRATMEVKKFGDKFYLAPPVVQRLIDLRVIQIQEKKGKGVLVRGSAAHFFDLIFPSKDSKDYVQVLNLVPPDAVAPKSELAAVKTSKADVIDDLIGQHTAGEHAPMPNIFNFVSSFTNDGVVRF